MIIYKNHFIRKHLGQHFLHDKLIINNIINIIDPKFNEIMIEIGPGLGYLTNQISIYLKNITVIEIDHNLILKLIKYPFLYSKLRILNKNVMFVDFRILSLKLGNLLRIFGNLPYNISISFLFYIFNYIDIIKDMHIMLQKEVVDRLIAKLNTKYYGKISILSQYFFKITKVLDVSSLSFFPIPKVNSILIKLVPRKSLFSKRELFNLYKLSLHLFNYRRKILYKSLSKFFTKQRLLNLNINLNLRAENLSIKQYIYLANLL